MKKGLFLALFLLSVAFSFGQKPINKIYDFGACIAFQDTTTHWSVMYPKTAIKAKYRHDVDLTVYNLFNGEVVARWVHSNDPGKENDLIVLSGLLMEILKYNNIDKNFVLFNE